MVIIRMCMGQDEKRIVKMSRNMSIEDKLDRKPKLSVKTGYQVSNEGKVNKTGQF